MSIDQQMDEDARALAELGYTQELHRGMSGFSNFAVSFSIISILAGCIIAVVVVLIFSLVSWQVSGKKNFMHGAKDEHTTVSKDEVLDQT